MLFDNMRTIVDRSRTQFNRAQYNERFYAFSKDAGFLPRSCLAYKPKTKGKVEALAKLTDRLKVYNGEFDSHDDLEKIVKEFNEEINNEVSAATGMTPNERFKEEQRYLNPLPKLEIFEEYLNLRPNKRKVTAESLITIEGKKIFCSTWVYKFIRFLSNNEWQNRYIWWVKYRDMHSSNKR